MVRGAFLVVGQDGLFLVGNLQNQELRGGAKAQRVAVVDAHGRTGPAALQLSTGSTT